MLFEKMTSCNLCRLCQTRTNIVWGSGNENTNLMLIGEGPGETEDKVGLPFQGKAGEKLNRILKYVGLSREEIYITNAVLCRPPNNRVPTPDEVQACNQRLIEEIQTIKPKLIVCLGRTAYTALTGIGDIKRVSDLFSDKPIPISVGDCKTSYIVTYHPSYHIRNPDVARQITLPHWNLVKSIIHG